MTLTKEIFGAIALFILVSVASVYIASNMKKHTTSTEYQQSVLPKLRSEEVSLKYAVFNNPRDVIVVESIKIHHGLWKTIFHDKDEDGKLRFFVENRPYNAGATLTLCTLVYSMALGGAPIDQYNTVCEKEE